MPWAYRGALLFWRPALGLARALTVAMVEGGHGGLHVLDATVGAGPPTCGRASSARLRPFPGAGRS